MVRGPGDRRYTGTRRRLCGWLAAGALLASCGGSEPRDPGTAGTARPLAAADTTGPVASTASMLPGTGTVLEQVDANGDGSADVLWTDAAGGGTHIWLMDGSAATGTAALFRHPDFRVIAAPDLDGDGRSDLVWHNPATGQTTAWLLDGTTVRARAELLTHPQFKVIATPDLDGDGKADLLWANPATGETTAWLMNGTAAVARGAILTHPAFTVIGTPDLDGDGKSDLLWFNPVTGQTTAWLMDGLAVKATAELFTHPGYRVIATPDLDGDGRSDLLWHNASTGETTAWVMNGTTVVARAAVFTHPGFKVIATPDLDGDGKADLVWYDATSGFTAAWLMDGTRPVARTELLLHPAFKVVATPDLDGDGRSDLLWHNAATGETTAWLMDGLTRRAAGAVLTQPGVAPAALLPPAPRPGGAVSYRLSGLNFSPYMDGQDPNNRTQISAAQIRGRLAAVRRYTQAVRTFSVADGLEAVPAIARSMGLEVAAGAWIGADLAENEAQLARLIAIGQAGLARTLIVGSEIFTRAASTGQPDVSEDRLLAYIARVRAAVPGVPVTYADTYDQLLAHPRITAAVDVLYANYYPYWQGVAIDDAMLVLHRSHTQLVQAAAGKPVVVSEAGWPSAGNTRGNAVPSAENAARFFVNFVSWARATNTSYHYFEAYDENWKALHGGAPQEAHWGLWDATGHLKPGMRAVFQGATVPDNWSVPGGPGAPDLVLTSVPAYGTFAPLRGRALHVDPDAHRIIVYIQVNGTWWVKPFGAFPLTSIAADGTWQTNVTTGGGDELATRLAAFLVRSNYTPTLIGNAPTLPAELLQSALASRYADRAPP